jgi:hypothetical protein
MGQIGSTLGNLVGIGQNAGLDTYGASPYGQNYGALTGQMNQNYQAVNASQTALANQLGNVASGQGPNPAQAVLNQSTGANVANQGALAAGQRGAAQNVGMMARGAANQGRAAQQQAAGQGASMQAQQQLGAMGQQANVLGQQGSEAIGGVGAYESAINSANQINAQTAANAAQFGQGFGGGLLQGVGSMLAGGGEVKMAGGGDPFGSGGDFAAAGGDYTSNQTPMPGGEGSGSSFVGQFLSGAGGNSGQASKKKNPGLFKSILGNLGKSQAAATNPASGSTSLGSGSSYNAALSPAGNAMVNSPGMAAGNAGYAGADMGAGAGAELGGAEAASAGGAADALVAAAKGGRAPKKVDALVSPGEHRVPKEAVPSVAKGKVSPLKTGETFPGKPKVKGNSYSNDTLPRKLNAGDIIIPNKVMQSKDPERGAAEFVRAILAKKRKNA